MSADEFVKSADGIVQSTVLQPRLLKYEHGDGRWIWRYRDRAVTVAIESYGLHIEYEPEPQDYRGRKSTVWSHDISLTASQAVGKEIADWFDGEDREKGSNAVTWLYLWNILMGIGLATSLIAKPWVACGGDLHVGLWWYPVAFGLFISVLVLANSIYLIWCGKAHDVAGTFHGAVRWIASVYYTNPKTFSTTVALLVLCLANTWFRYDVHVNRYFHSTTVQDRLLQKTTFATWDDCADNS